MSGRATLATARLRLATAGDQDQRREDEAGALGAARLHRWRQPIPSMTAVTRRVRQRLRGWARWLSERKRPEAPRSREGPAGGLAAAAGAALAGRAARQRLGGRRRRRHRPLRHRHRRQGADAPVRPRPRPGRLRPRGREAARLHPLPHRPLRAGGADRRGRRLRALDAPAPGSTCACSPTTRRRRSSSGSRWRARAASRSPALERYRESRSDDDDNGIDAIVEPDRDLAPRGRGRDRPRHLAGLRDPRPRALARRPAPARAQADDLRRPPARPHRALLRPRPQPRPGRRIPRAASTEVEPLEVDLCLPGHGRPFRDPEAKIAEARRQVDELLGKVRDVARRGREDRLRDRRRDRRRRERQHAGQRLGPADRPLLPRPPGDRSARSARSREPIRSAGGCLGL